MWLNPQTRFSQLPHHLFPFIQAPIPLLPGELSCHSMEQWGLTTSSPWGHITGCSNGLWWSPVSQSILACDFPQFIIQSSLVSPENLIDAKGPIWMTFKYLHLQWGTVLTEKLQILCPGYFQASFDLNCPSPLWGTSWCVLHVPHTAEWQPAFHNVALLSSNWSFGNSNLKQESEMQTSWVSKVGPWETIRAHFELVSLSLKSRLNFPGLAEGIHILINIYLENMHLISQSIKNYI